MKRRNFKNLNVYQKSFSLTKEVYRLTKKLESTRLSEQLISTSLSISSNIAEGAERNSEKSFYYFLNIASASCAELYNQLRLVADEEPDLNAKAELLISNADEVHRMIRGLMMKVSH